jgi:hypothetical protein
MCGHLFRNRAEASLQASALLISIYVKRIHNQELMQFPTILRGEFSTIGSFTIDKYSEKRTFLDHLKDIASLALKLGNIA